MHFPRQQLVWTVQRTQILIPAFASCRIGNLRLRLQPESRACAHTLQWTCVSLVKQELVSVRRTRVKCLIKTARGAAVTVKSQRSVTVQLFARTISQHEARSQTGRSISLCKDQSQSRILRHVRIITRLCSQVCDGSSRLLGSLCPKLSWFRPILHSKADTIKRAINLTDDQINHQLVWEETLNICWFQIFWHEKLSWAAGDYKTDSLLCLMI